MRVTLLDLLIQPYVFQLVHAKSALIRITGWQSIQVASTGMYLCPTSKFLPCIHFYVGANLPGRVLDSQKRIETLSDDNWARRYRDRLTEMLFLLKFAVRKCWAPEALVRSSFSSVFFCLSFCPSLRYFHCSSRFLTQGWNSRLINSALQAQECITCQREKADSLHFT